MRYFRVRSLPIHARTQQSTRDDIQGALRRGRACAGRCERSNADESAAQTGSARSGVWDGERHRVTADERKRRKIGSKKGGSRNKRGGEQRTLTRKCSERTQEACVHDTRLRRTYARRGGPLSGDTLPCLLLFAAQPCTARCADIIDTAGACARKQIKCAREEGAGRVRGK